MVVIEVFEVFNICLRDFGDREGVVDLLRVKTHRSLVEFPVIDFAKGMSGRIDRPVILAVSLLARSGVAVGLEVHFLDFWSLSESHSRVEKVLCSGITFCSHNSVLEAICLAGLREIVVVLEACPERLSSPTRVNLLLEFLQSRFESFRVSILETVGRRSFIRSMEPINMRDRGQCITELARVDNSVPNLLHVGFAIPLDIYWGLWPLKGLGGARAYSSGVDVGVDAVAGRVLVVLCDDTALGEFWSLQRGREGRGLSSKLTFR